VNEDLDKARQRWSQRRLFTPQPRRRGRWLWPFLLAVLAMLFYGLGSRQIAEIMNLPLG
jgi:hypothetical protein